jgi:hypothetical protein
LTGCASAVLFGVADWRLDQTRDDEILAKAELLAAERADDESDAAGIPTRASQIAGFLAVSLLSVAVTVF